MVFVVGRRLRFVSDAFCHGQGKKRAQWPPNTPLLQFVLVEPFVMTERQPKRGRNGEDSRGWSPSRILRDLVGLAGSETQKNCRQLRGSLSIVSQRFWVPSSPNYLRR